MHFQTAHYQTPHYDTFHYLVRNGKIITPPAYGGGGRGSYYNQAPPKYQDHSKIEDPYLQQALQEDDEFLLICSSFIKVIQCL